MKQAEPVLLDESADKGHFEVGVVLMGRSFGVSECDEINRR